MTSIRTMALSCAVATMAMLPLTAGAQGLRNQDTYFTFSQAVELPGATLPAGKYLFVLADSPSNRHIVRIMSEDRDQLHATLLAIPNYSLDEPSDEPQVRFMEGPETGPQAVKVWFYPGRTVGHEFIYPRSQAMKIAQRTGDKVLTTKTETAIAENVSDEDMTRVDRNGVDSADVRMADQSASQSATAQDRAMAQDRTPAPTAPSASATSTERADTPAPAPQRADAASERSAAMPERTAPAPDRTASMPDASERQELPRTASLLPLLGLIGVGSLIGSRWLRRSRRPRA